MAAVLLEPEPDDAHLNNRSSLLRIYTGVVANENASIDLPDRSPTVPHSTNELSLIYSDSSARTGTRSSPSSSSTSLLRRFTSH